MQNILLCCRRIDSHGEHHLSGVAQQPSGVYLLGEGDEMKAQLVEFGSIEIDGRQYDHDVVIEQGAVRKRIKKPSKPQRGRYGHTPLSAEEEIPWGGSRLIIGTGAYGSLPITPQLSQEAARRGVELVAIPTADACGLIAGLDRRDVNAILHVTC
jgi:hypothetical protein